MYFSGTLKIKIKLNTYIYNINVKYNININSQSKGNTSFRQKYFLAFVLKESISHIVQHSYQRYLIAYFMKQLCHIIFPTLSHENNFDPPIPHVTPLLSLMSTSLTTVNLIYVVQVFSKNIPKIGISVLCRYIILANLF